MPETPIHKHNRTLAAESEIWLTKQGLIPPPPDNAMSAKKFCQCKLSPFITAPANARHDFGTLCFGENIGHEQLLKA